MSGEAKALLVDISECIGCRACMEGCMQAHDFTGDAFEVEKLSTTAYTVVEEKGDYFVRKLCMHCVTPSCVSVCPVAALQKTDTGPVVYDSSRCMGCRYCIQACPFEVPRYEWDSSIPSVTKCDMCVERQERGEMPACAEACPVGATVFGTREELLEEAHRRIDESPDKYYPHVYGETEAGGTSTLFLSPVSFEELGFRTDLGDIPLPVLTQQALERIPGIVTVGGSVLLATWWITHRREEVARAETIISRSTKNPEEETDDERR